MRAISDLPDQLARRLAAKRERLGESRTSTSLSNPPLPEFPVTSGVNHADNLRFPGLEQINDLVRKPADQSSPSIPVDLGVPQGFFFNRAENCANFRQKLMAQARTPLLVPSERFRMSASVSWRIVSSQITLFAR